MPAPDPFTAPDARREWLRDQLRCKRVLPDGERIRFPMTAMDHAAYGFQSADGSPDHTNPHAPGHRFADVNDAAKAAADQSYEQMRTRLDYRHRDGASDRGSQQRTLSLDALEQLAADSYAQRNDQMRNAWRRP